MAEPDPTPPLSPAPTLDWIQSQPDKAQAGMPAQYLSAPVKLRITMGHVAAQALHADDPDDPVWPGIWANAESYPNGRFRLVYAERHIVARMFTCTAVSLRGAGHLSHRDAGALRAFASNLRTALLVHRRRNLLT